MARGFTDSRVVDSLSLTCCAAVNPTMLHDWRSDLPPPYCFSIPRRIRVTSVLGDVCPARVSQTETGPGRKAVFLSIHHSRRPRPTVRSSGLRIAHFFLPIFLMTSPIGPARLERGALIGRRARQPARARARARFVRGRFFFSGAVRSLVID